MGIFLEKSSFNLFELETVRKNWGWFLFWGISLVILGLLAIGAAGFTTLISVFFLGVLIFVSGVVIIIDSFTFWRQHWGSFFLHLVMGALYLIGGFLLLKNPLIGAVTLTLILGVMYVVLGVFRIFSTTALQLPGWGWALFSGIITLILGLLILIHWPETSLFIIGLFVGIELLFIGWAYIMLSLSAHKFSKETY